MRKHLKIAAFCALFYSPFCYSQDGSSCGDAITLYPTFNYDYSQHTTADSVFWFEFLASSPYVNISLETPKYGLDVPHIHSLKLFSGSCGSLSMVAEDELPHYSEAKFLNIDLNASNLQIGQTYYIRVDRKVPHHECSRSGCTANNSTDPSTFSIAIKKIFLVIPPDMLVEPPTSGWGMEANRGQLLDHTGAVADEVKMYNDHSNPGVFICEDRIAYVFAGEQSGQKAHQRVDMTFENANANYDIFKTEQTAGITNYYLPHIPDGITNSKSYSRVVLPNLYANIDYHQYSNIEGLKNYFVVYPGGRIDHIRLKFEGADSVNLDTLNTLKIVSSLGSTFFEKPHVYTVDSTGYPVAIICNAHYQFVDDYTIGFSIVGYSGTEPLIIVMDQGHAMPVPKSIDNLLWSTYYGSTEDDYINDVDHDDQGNVYFTGWTWGLTFPHNLQTVYSPASDYARIVAGSHKPLGERRWCTIYGGQSEQAFGLATDNLGNVYVTGTSGVYSDPNEFIDVPRAGAYNLAPSPSVVAATYGTLYRFNQSNGLCTWATLFGEHTNSAAFVGRCIATDNAGNVYIAGEGKRVSNSPLIGSGSQYLQSTTGSLVGYVAKFNAANALTWSTMFGNNDLIVNEMNTVINPQTSESELFIVGTTSGTNTNMFPLETELLNDYQVNYQGGASDAFFAKFNSSDQLKWSSFFGGAGEDLGLGIDYNPLTTSLFITGQTKSNSTSFPLQDLGNAQIHFNDILDGSSDGFISVLKFITETTGGHILYYSSYFGGSSDDQCNNVEISESGNVYVIGMSKSQDFPVQQLSGNYYQDVLENDPTGIHYDAFLIGLNPALAYGWSTLFGGEWYYNGTDNINAQSNDYGNGITIYNDEILYIGGTTNSNQDFPITVDLTASPNAYIQYDNSGSPIDVPNGWTDGFLAQFDMTDVELGLYDLETGDSNGSLIIYPNPSNGNFSIVGSNLKLEDKVTIEVVNVIGQRIYSKTSTISNGEMTEFISLGNLSDGLYIVNIGDGTRKVSRRVVVK